MSETIQLQLTKGQLAKLRKGSATMRVPASRVACGGCNVTMHTTKRMKDKIMKNKSAGKGTEIALSSSNTTMSGEGIRDIAKGVSTVAKSTMGTNNQISQHLDQLEHKLKDIENRAKSMVTGAGVPKSMGDKEGGFILPLLAGVSSAISIINGIRNLTKKGSALGFSSSQRHHGRGFGFSSKGASVDGAHMVEF